MKNGGTQHANMCIMLLIRTDGMGSIFDNCVRNVLNGAVAASISAGAAGIMRRRWLFECGVCISDSIASGVTINVSRSDIHRTGCTQQGNHIEGVETRWVGREGVITSSPLPNFSTPMAADICIPAV